MGSLLRGDVRLARLIYILYIYIPNKKKENFLKKEFIQRQISDLIIVVGGISRVIWTFVIFSFKLTDLLQNRKNEDDVFFGLEKNIIFVGEERFD